MTSSEQHPHTPDGSCFIVRGRLWRLAHPAIDPAMRQKLVAELMSARRALRGKPDAASLQPARDRVDAAKCALGERGPVWWADGAPDYSRKMVADSPYAAWYEACPRRR